MTTFGGANAPHVLTPPGADVGAAMLQSNNMFGQAILQQGAMFGATMASIATSTSTALLQANRAQVSQQKAEPRRAPYDPRAHLRQPPGRRVSPPCHKCVNEGREDAFNHYYHECPRIGSTARHSARQRYMAGQQQHHQAPQQLPAPAQQLAITDGREQQQQQQQQTGAAQLPAVAEESDLSRSLRDNLEEFATTMPGATLLQVAQAYRSSLWARQTRNMREGRDVDLQGQIYAWLEAYIESLERSSQ